MILVTGTKRSGTSMWMQVLKEGGFPVIGEPFTAVWEQSIKEANPRGFYESPFRQGVFYATNPHPKTGAWLHPNQVKRHVVKVFIPGLVRSDYAYIDNVVATMRNWRTYPASIQRLLDMEDAWILEQEDGEAKLAKVKQRRGKLPPALEWWFETFDLIRDFATRRYAINLCTYDRMLREPDAVIHQVFDWLGEGDVDKAVAAVEPKLTSQKPADTLPEGIEPEHAELMDTLYHTLDSGGALEPSLLEEMNRIHEGLVETWGKLSRERSREDEDHLAAKDAEAE